MSHKAPDKVLHNKLSMLIIQLYPHTVASTGQQHLLSCYKMEALQICLLLKVPTKPRCRATKQGEGVDLI